MTHDAHKRHRMHIKKCGSIKLQMLDRNICISLSLIGAGLLPSPVPKKLSPGLSGAFIFGDCMKITELAEEYQTQYEKLTEKTEKLQNQIRAGKFIGEDLHTARKRICTLQEMALECRITADKLAHYYDHLQQSGHEHLAGDF